MATAFDVFVSYSRHDQPIVVPVVQLLRLGEGTMVFLDVDTIRPGERWRERLEAAIAGARYVVVFWCAHASGSAEVAREIAAAVQGGKSLVPVLLDDTPLPEPLTDYQWIDMKALAGAAHTMALPAAVPQQPSATPATPATAQTPPRPPRPPAQTGIPAPLSPPARAPAPGRGGGGPPATAPGGGSPPGLPGWIGGLLKRTFGGLGGIAASRPADHPPRDETNDAFVAAPPDRSDGAAAEAPAAPPPGGPTLTGGGAGGIALLNAIAETLRTQLAERAARDDAAIGESGQTPA